jgi:hypothetical protein
MEVRVLRGGFALRAITWVPLLLDLDGTCSFLSWKWRSCSFQVRLEHRYELFLHSTCFQNGGYCQAKKARKSLPYGAFAACLPPFRWDLDLIAGQESEAVYVDKSPSEGCAARKTVPLRYPHNLPIRGPVNS